MVLCHEARVDRSKRFEPQVYGALKISFTMFAARAVIVIGSCVRSTIRFKDSLQGPWKPWAHMASLLSDHWWSGHGREFLRHPKLEVDTLSGLFRRGLVFSCPCLDRNIFSFRLLVQ